MPKARYSDRRDDNERAIIEEFEKRGFLVIQMPRSAGYDLQVHGRNFSFPPIEVKNPDTAWDFTHAEKAMISKCKEMGIDYITLFYSQEVEELIGKAKR